MRERAQGERCRGKEPLGGDICRDPAAAGEDFFFHLHARIGTEVEGSDRFPCTYRIFVPGKREDKEQGSAVAG